MRPESKTGGTGEGVDTGPLLLCSEDSTNSIYSYTMKAYSLVDAMFSAPETAGRIPETKKQTISFSAVCKVEYRSLRSAAISSSSVLLSMGMLMSGGHGLYGNTHRRQCTH